MSGKVSRRDIPGAVVLVRWHDVVVRQRLIPHGAKILVGVSGGADSVALLHLLYALRHDLALHLTVAHYDHALRPGSAKDCAFVRKVCAGLALDCVWERNKLKKPAGVSTEDFARQRRFDFFVRKARLVSADAVVLAHTQDDLAETVLMRLLRGTGLSGLRAILPRRIIAGTVFVRPMLDMTRAEVERFIAEQGLLYREDPTNAGDDFLRNRIRHKLIPYISKEFSPVIKNKLAELAVNAALDHEFIDDELQKVLPQVMRMYAAKAVITRAAWCALSSSMRRMVLREGVARMNGALAGALACKHVEVLERAGLEGVKTVLSLPLGLRGAVTDKFITLS